MDLVPGLWTSAWSGMAKKKKIIMEKLEKPLFLNLLHQIYHLIDLILENISYFRFKCSSSEFELHTRAHTI